MSGFAPGFLVASPSLRCPFFHHTVVLLVDHGEDGSFGFVINKKSSVDFARVVEELELEPGDSLDVPVLSGGPVSPESGWIVFDPKSASDPPSDVIKVTDHVGVTASLNMLEAIAAGRRPERVLLSLGYSGWAPGQLEMEMREGSWIPVDLEADVVFDLPVEERWETALRRLGIDPARVAVGTRGDALN